MVPLTIYIGGKTVEIHPVGPAHTNGDVVVLFPDYRVLASGDIFANGPGTSAQLVDYPGGGSAKAWPHAIESALKLDFDTVVPGHGLVSKRSDLEAYLDRSMRFSATMTGIDRANIGRATNIEKVVRRDFAWEDFHVQAALDGLIRRVPSCGRRRAVGPGRRCSFRGRRSAHAQQREPFTHCQHRLLHALVFARELVERQHRLRVRGVQLDDRRARERQRVVHGDQAAAAHEFAAAARSRRR